MSKIIKGPWKDRNYDPTKDPEFKLEPTSQVWSTILVIGIVIFAIATLYELSGL